MSTGVVCAIEASSKRRTNPTPKQPIGALDVLSRDVLSRNEAAAGVTRKSHAGDNRGIPFVTLLRGVARPIAKRRAGNVTAVMVSRHSAITADEPTLPSCPGD